MENYLASKRDLKDCEIITSKQHIDVAHASKK